MRTQTQTHARGFTLVEMVIAIGVTAILVGAAMSLMISQQSAFRNGSEDRGLQESGRIALTQLTEQIRTAGYGLDPAYTLDFGPTDPVPQNGLAPPALAGALSTFKCDDPINCRDRTDAPDELVFYSRDPMFSRPVVSATTNELVFHGQREQPLWRGQVLQVMCLTGKRLRAYVTVGAAVPGAVPANATTDVRVPLQGGVQINTHDAFPFQNAQLTDPCFSDGNAVVAKVDRYRFHLVGFQEDGTRIDPAEGADLQANGTRPYLMLDQGLFEGDGGETVDVPVAADVEDLQFTYLYPAAAAGGALREVGGTEGTPASGDVFPMTLVTPPEITDAPTAVTRGTGSPVNVQGIRVSLVVRTADADVRYVTDEDRTVPPTPMTNRAAGDHDPLANRPSYLGQPLHRRALFETTVLLPNLRNGVVIYCVVDPTGSQPGLNYGGC